MGGTMNMSLPDHLDDLTVRFLLNLPASELSSVPRLCFQVEEAQWFYEDFIRPAAAAAGQPLPSLTLRQFCLALFQHCPLLKGFSDEMHIAAYEEFLAYKVRVPVRGAILMSDDMERLVLVKGWKKGASWSFPRGKINKDEKDLDCAIREVYEETGYDVREAGLVPDDESEVKAIDVTMREQHMKLFVFRGVKEDTYFEPKTRKEISKIQWYNVRDLPGFKRQKNGDTQHANKFYMVAPFLGHLKKWIKEQRQKDMLTSTANNNVPISLVTEDEEMIGIMTDPVIDKAEELRRLLMIPGPQHDTAHEFVQSASSPPTGPPNQTQTNDLLALLRGQTQSFPGSQTPFDHLNTRTLPQHDILQSQHTRHAPTQHSRPPIQNYLPDQLQKQQFEQFQGNTDTSNFGPTGIPQHAPHPAWAASHPPSVMAHQITQGTARSQHEQMNYLRSPPQAPPPTLRQPPGMPSQAFMPHYQSLDTGSRPQHIQGGPAGIVHPHPSQYQQKWPPGPQAPKSVEPQGLHGAIAAGPSVPNPESLPVPKMNAHSMKLLGAFKDHASTSSGPSTNQAGQAMRQASVQQNALLSLLKQEKEITNPSVDRNHRVEQAEKQSSPASLQRRQSALNEITRTLPVMKVQSPPPLQPEAVTRHEKVDDSRPSTPRPRPETKVVSGLVTDSDVSTNVRPQQVSKTILQRLDSSTSLNQNQKMALSPPRVDDQRAKIQSSTRKAHSTGNKVTGHTGISQVKPITILARPSSRSGSGSGIDAERARSAASSVRPASTKTSVLPREDTIQRYTSGHAQAAQNGLSQDEIVDRGAVKNDARNDAKNEHKKDQLLALFGRKDRAAQVASPSPKPMLTPTSDPVSIAVSRPNSMVIPVSNSPSIINHQPTIERSLSFIPAPQPTPIGGENLVGANNNSLSNANKQQTLLDLFSKSTTSTLAAPLAELSHATNAQNIHTYPKHAFSGSDQAPSPSPTPLHHEMPGRSPAQADRSVPQSLPAFMDRNTFTVGITRPSSNLGLDITSPVSAGGRSTGSPTPIETKGFLLNFLNGVVQKEGMKGKR